MKAVIVFLSLGLLFAACHKHNEQQPKTKTQMVSNRWNIQTISERTFVNGAPVDTVIVGTPADYFEFGIDAIAKVHFFNIDVNYNWKIEGDSIIFNDAVKFGIETLTDTKLVLHEKTMENQTEYVEVRYNLSK